MLRFIIHYGIHFIVPFLISYFFFKKTFFKTSAILLAAILIDLDHLLAEPVYDSLRCSIGFHLLHSYIAIIAYTLLFYWKKTRIIGLAALLHMLADITDCILLAFDL